MNGNEESKKIPFKIFLRNEVSTAVSVLSFELHLFQLKSIWEFQHRSFWTPQPWCTLSGRPEDKELIHGFLCSCVHSLYHFNYQQLFQGRLQDRIIIKDNNNGRLSARWMCPEEGNGEGSTAEKKGCWYLGWPVLLVNFENNIFVLSISFGILSYMYRMKAK